METLGNTRGNRLASTKDTKEEDPSAELRDL